MPRESEIKLRVFDLLEMRRKIAALGAREDTRRHFEDNLVFDTPDSSLMNQGKLLRLRCYGNEVLVTFKEPAVIRNSIKHREETEFHVDSADAFRLFLEQLGYVVRFRYQKYRQVWCLGEEVAVTVPPSVGGELKQETTLHIMLDETPIGNFLELEGEEERIVSTAALLDYAPRDFISESYAVLYAEDCRRKGLPCEHMVFDSQME